MLESLPQVNDVTALAKLHRSALDYTCDPAKARSVVREARRLARQDKQHLARALATLGACQLASGRAFKEANSALLEALPLCEALGDDALTAEVLLNLGYSYTELCDPDRALVHLENSLTLCRRAALPELEARGLRLIGNAYTALGHWREALATLLEALALGERLGFKRLEQFFQAQPLQEKAALYRGIAIVYSNLGECERAIDYYQTALAIYKETDPTLAARTLYNIGIAYEEWRDDTSALRFYQASADLYRAHGNADGFAISLLGVGGVWQRGGELVRAERALNEARATLEQSPDHVPFYTDALWTLADLRLAQARPEDALELLETAHDLMVRTRRPASNRAELHRQLAQTHKALGNFAQALEHYERYTDLTTAHLKEAAEEKAQRLRIRFDTEQALKDRDLLRSRSTELEREIKERKGAEALLAQAKQELERKNRILKALSSRDPLTGLYNRRYLDHLLASTFTHAKRYGQPLSLAVFDIDNFKRINDTFSHMIGDEVLRRVAGQLGQVARAQDILARYGGEEFVLVLPGSDLAAARRCCEAARAAVAAYDWSQVRAGLVVTLSVGLCPLAHHARPADLFAKADTKLYAAKQSGKNRVCT